MNGHIPSTLFGLVMVATVVAIVLTIFAWRWAVRRPLPGDMPTIDAPPHSFLYVAIGASDVVGLGADDPERENWAAVVHRYMPERTRLLRLARPGITLRDARALEVPRAAEARPNLVTLWNCVNDAVGGVALPVYTTELTGALSALLTNTATRVLVLNLPDISLVAGRGLPASQLDLVRGGALQWNRAIAEAVRPFKQHVKVFDMFEVSAEAEAHPEYISADGFHPSSAGYARLAELVWSEITRLGWAPEAV